MSEVADAKFGEYTNNNNNAVLDKGNTQNEYIVIQTNKNIRLEYLV